MYFMVIVRGGFDRPEWALVHSLVERDGGISTEPEK
jgi:hypothetical protein